MLHESGRKATNKAINIMAVSRAVVTSGAADTTCSQAALGDFKHRCHLHQLVSMALTV